ncbi:7-cyano-7-deazaguanine synthase [Candidatus Parcubacteria bacterium]|nr:7-cyano-7-deazaguanine synthase [Candidatus Parcubacteria bacterium]
MQSPVLIIELGSQHTLQIARVLRELGHRSFILKPDKAEDYMLKNMVSCVIGSGGMKSVYEPQAPRVPRVLFEELDTPYLGICYGMQDMAIHYAGKVERGVPEYASAHIEMEGSSLFSGLVFPIEVWMSHADCVTEVPSDCCIIARSTENRHVAAIAHLNGKHFGVQFHPEVSNTERGAIILKNFVELIAGRKPDLSAEALPDLVRERIVREVGEDDAILLFSGGVDSTTVAALAAPVLRKRLHAVTFDGGHLRENEVEQIKQNAVHAGVELTVIDAADTFIESFRDKLDPEEKRQAFRIIYAQLGRNFALERGASKIVQGTIAPDRIESGMTGGARIKTHHNSAGLDFGNLVEVHPIEELFKDEVRALSKQLGLPPDIFNRPPFPGPGNFLRVVGIPITREVLSVVQWAEARTQAIVGVDPRYRTMSQLVVAALGRSVGVKGDGRVFGYTIGIRGVRTKDFMTAEGVEFEPDFQRVVKKKLGEHPLITQVGFFPIDKPPGTTEFE